MEQTGADGSSQVLGKKNVIEDCRSQYLFETLEGKRLWVRRMKRQWSLCTGDKSQQLRFGRRTHPTLPHLEVSLAILVTSAWSDSSLLSLGVAIDSCDKLCMCPVSPKVLKWELMSRCSQALWDLMSSERSPTGSLLSPVWHRNHSPCLCTGSGARALGSGHSRESLPDAATGSRWGHGPWLWPKSVEAINEDHCETVPCMQVCVQFSVYWVYWALWGLCKHTILL